jgi:fructose/tagatose bisphosphate aldolase
VALERTIDYLNDEVPCVLHGAFGSANFTQLLDKLSFGATAITVNRDEKIVLVDSTKQAVGEWQIEQGRLQLYNSDLVLKIYGSELVYKSRREDFQDVIRQGLV